MTNGPKRTSTEPTLVIPREALPPRASAVHEVMAAVHGPSEYETLVPCPSCEHCPSCNGCHMVSPRRAAEIRSGAPPPPELDEP